MATQHPVRPADCRNCVIRENCSLARLGNDPAAALPQIRERIFQRGDVLLEEGRTADFVRVVKLGIAFNYRRGLDGRSRPIMIASRGGPLGLFATFEMPSQATCVALTTVRACEIPVAELRRMVVCGSGLQVQIGRSVAEIFAALTLWSEAMRLPGLINQLAYVLVLLADASQAPVVELPSHSALAELLGTRRESIARALRSLESAGGIRRHERRRCEVHRQRLLRRIAQGG